MGRGLLTGAGVSRRGLALLTLLGGGGAGWPHPRLRAESLEGSHDPSIVQAAA